MWSCIGLCLPLCLRRSSNSKRSNVKTLREILKFLVEADEETSQLANTILRSVLVDLVHQSDVNAPTHLDEHGTRCMLDQPTLKQISLALRRIGYNPSRSRLPTEPPPSRITPEETYSRQPRSSSPTRIHPPGWDQRYSDELVRWLGHSSTAKLVELLLQMDAVKQWPTLLPASQLDCVDPMALPSLPVHVGTTHAGRIRLASWNVNRFTLAKARHPGFREVLCLTVLRARIALLVLQEVACVDVVNVLCAELNNPTLPHIRQWLAHHPPDHVPSWEAATSIQSVGAMFRGAEYAAFLYDRNAGIRIRRTQILEPRRSDAVGAVPRALRLFARSPCSALCMIRGERFVIVSVHLKAQGLRHSRVGKTSAEVESLTHLVHAFKDTQPGGTHLIAVGDFNLNPDHEAFSGLRNQGLSSVLGAHQATTVACASRSDPPSTPTTDCTQPSGSSAAFDNAWISSSLMTAFYSGDCGVITHGLKHPLIPDDTGAGANGFISDHCPIWFDLIIPSPSTSTTQ